MATPDLRYCRHCNAIILPSRIFAGWTRLGTRSAYCDPDRTVLHEPATTPDGSQ